MPESSSYEIGQRVARYMNHIGLSSAQFADKAGIPRASMSQLISGRNQSVSSLLLGRLHDAFPDLNLMWVLFGRGDMQENTNFETSEGLNELADIASDEELGHYGFIPPSRDESETEPAAFGPPLFSPDIDTAEPPRKAAAPKVKNADTMQSPGFMHDASEMPAAPAHEESDPSQSVAEKQVKRVLILYTDGTFDSYIPS